MTSVAVLLPARIETRFDRPDSEGVPRRLRVIVIPADVWFDRHDPRVGDHELDLVEGAAQACGGDLLGEAGAAAFDRLAGQVGAGRAAWLAATLVERDAAGGWTLRAPAQRRSAGDPAAPRMIRGLPAQVQVWATLRDSREVLLATLQPTRDLSVEPGRGGEAATFWPRWDSLDRAGLTAVVDLAGGDQHEPIDPADIAVLTAVGLGDADPGGLLLAHQRSGAAHLMTPGTPTNTTPEAAHRPPGAPQWCRAASAPSAPSAELAGALGVPLALPGAERHRETQRMLVSALWPVLWGHALRDIVGWPAGADEELIGAQRWWASHVLAEGPFPSLVVGDQPYGVLPVTDLLAVGAGGVERWTAAGAAAYLDQAAARAEQRPATVVDADTEGVLRVLGSTPVSTGYRYRWSVPAQGLVGPLRDAYEERQRRALGQLGPDPSEFAGRQVVVGSSWPVSVPLVDGRAEEEPPPWLYRMMDDLGADVVAGHLDEADYHALEGLDPWAPANRHRVWLLRLVALSRQHAPEPGAGSVIAVAEALSGYETSPGLLVRLGMQSVRVAHAWPAGGAAAEAYRAALAGLRALALRPVDDPADLERRLAATLDCATHRLDALPAAVGLVRLEAMGQAPRALGLYGWVDAPYRGEPGFAGSRAVLAPSPAQAKAAAILRDRFAAHAESGRTPLDAWDLGLDSGAVRRAVGLLDAVAEGAHPSEALGRRVEACFSRYSDVLRLRGGDPAGGPGAGGYPADPDAPLRRTCDGLAAMRDWAGDRAGFAARTGLDPAAIPAEAAAELDALAAAPGVVADLHLLEAVHDTVQGGSAAAAASLDALAGLGEVPELRSLRTPAPGTPLTTTVLLSLPRAAEPGPDVGRAVMADPAVARILDAMGDPADPAAFGWHVGGQTITLADLGLAVGDLAAVDDAALLAAVAAVGPPGAGERIDQPAGVDDVRRLVSVLARCAPPVAQPADVADLQSRYARVHAAATALLADLRAAVPGAGDDPLLRRRALRWGLSGGFAEAAAVLAVGLDRCPAVAEVLDPDPRRRADPAAALRLLAAAGRGDPHATVVPVLVALADAPPPVPAAEAHAWAETFRRVRPRLAQALEALGARVSGTFGQGWGAHWTGRPVPGSAGLPGTARELVVWLGVDDAEPAGGATGVLDLWHETLPGRWSAEPGAASAERIVPATGAFGFNAPGARPQQAILLAAPPTPDAPLDVALLRRVLAQTRLLVRVRALRGPDLGRLAALLPSALIPAGAHGIRLDDAFWQAPTDDPGLHVRLEQDPAGDVDAALQARTADPLWMMTRQWQLGEHQGEDASSPVWVRAEARTTALEPEPRRPFADPAAAPGSAVLEAAGRDWAGAAGTADPFDTSQFAYTAELVGGGARFLARQHPGGPTDWWSADVAGQFHAAGPTRTAAGVPGRMRYPGAPAPGWCTLEDPRESVTAHLPDTAHVGSLFFLDLVAGHATDWYLFPLPTPPGRVLSVRAVTVTDSFGDTWRLPDSAWGPSQRWSLFRTSGLSATDLLVWPADHPPLAGPVLERVVLGVDEDANLLWAVEDIVEGGGPLPDAPADAAVPTDNVAPAVAYQPLGEPPPRWHPYPAHDAAEPRRFRAGRLATRAEPGLTPLPDPGSRILRSDAVHLIDPAAVPAAGLAVERRWVLARNADGSPALWQQHSRRVPAAPPALRLPFDVVGPA